jgi:hypothetical protein
VTIVVVKRVNGIDIYLLESIKIEQIEQKISKKYPTKNLFVNVESPTMLVIAYGIIKKNVSMKKKWKKFKKKKKKKMI